jgi:ribonuclease HI
MNTLARAGGATSQLVAKSRGSTIAMARRRVKVFFDGGCRPNPGHMEAAVVIRGAEYLFDDLGLGTSSDAEWLALFRALELSQALGLNEVELAGDALIVIRQANSALANGHAVHGHAATFLALANKARPTRIRWIKREQNLAGIALGRRHPR